MAQPTKLSSCSPRPYIHLQRRSTAVMPQRRSTAASSLAEKVGISLLSAVGGAVIKTGLDYYTGQEKKIEELRKDYTQLDKNVALELQSLNTGVQSLHTKLNTVQEQLASIASAVSKPPQQI